MKLPENYSQRKPRTAQEIAGMISYALGYSAVMLTIAKLTWWIWQQPL